MVFDHFAKLFLALQHRLFYVVMSLGRFNLYVNSYTYLYRKAFDTKRARGGNWAWRLEITGLIFFWTWFGRVLYGCGTWQKALAYVLVSHVVTSPLHVQVILFFHQIKTKLNDRLGFKK
jgi:sphingolipid 8-(E)-desaturase